MTQPDFSDIKKAHDRIRDFVHRTPILTCRSINGMIGASLFFKCENFQKAGAFKIRGACNAVFSIPEEEAAAAWRPTPQGTMPRHWPWQPGGEAYRPTW